MTFNSHFQKELLDFLSMRQASLSKSAYAHDCRYLADFDRFVVEYAAEIRFSGRKKHERGPCLHCLRHVFVFKSFFAAENAGRTIEDSVPYLSIYWSSIIIVTIKNSREWE